MYFCLYASSEGPSWYWEELQEPDSNKQVFKKALENFQGGTGKIQRSE